MSFAVFQQLTRSTVIDACLVCPFTSGEATNLILCKGDLLEVYDVQRRQSKLLYAFSSPLFGRPEALGAFRPRPGAASHLAVVLRRARYLAVLRYDPEFGNVQTCGQHVLVPSEDAASAASSSSAVGLQAQVAVDPEHRCVAVRTAPDRVLVFPVSSEASWQREAGPAVSQKGGLAFHQDQDHPPGLGAPFQFGAYAPLRLRHIEEVKLLPGYRQPTAACLGQVRPGWGARLTETNMGNCSLSVIVFDLEERSVHLIWTVHHLPHDVFRIVPLSPPVGGMLALSKNAAIYLKEHGPGFCQKLNSCAGLGSEFEKTNLQVKDEAKLEVLLTGCSVAVLSPTVLVFSVPPAGRLYLAHLLLTSMDTVGDILWTSPATVTPAWDLCPVGDEFLFLAADSGGGTMLKLSQAKKKLPQQAPYKRARTAEKKDDETASSELDALRALHVQMAEAARSIRSYNFGSGDELQSFGAIKCMAPWVRDAEKDKEEEEDEKADNAEEEIPLSGTERFVCCSGTGVKGAMYIFQRAVPLESLTEFDLPVGAQYSAVWTFRQPSDEPVVSQVPCKRDRSPGGGEGADEDDEEEEAAALAAAAFERTVPPHRLVLLSGTSRSMVLETTDEIEEISKETPLDADAPTVCAGGVFCDSLAVQVTPQRMCFMSTRNPKSAEGLPAPFAFAAEGTGDAGVSEACKGSVCDPYIAVAFKDRSLRLFRAMRREMNVEDITGRLPSALAGPVVCTSLYRHRSSGNHLAACLLAVVTPECGGTLRILEVRGMQEVFRVERLSDVPPVLRNACGRGKGGKEAPADELDHMRAITDPCAVPSRAGGDAQEQREPAKAREAAGDGSTPPVVCAELVEIDDQDSGPTLVVLVLGRPMLLYRAFTSGGCAIPTDEDRAASADGAAAGGTRRCSFPFHFALQEHDLLGIVEFPPSGAYRPVAAFRHPGGTPSGAVIVPPHAGVSALWLAAKRNRLHVHPLPGSQVRGFAPLHAACCEHGFFAISQGSGVGTVTAQICAPAVVEGLPDGQASFDLHTAVPCARRVIGRTPQQVATRPVDRVIALAVSDAVEEAPDQAAGPSIEEDPLGDDWSIVRVPPVEADPPPMPRYMQRYELWLGRSKDLGKLGQYRFSFDADEHVLTMKWVTLTGFPMPSLVVGTGVNTSEDLTCRGRLLIFSIEGREPGVIPPVYQRSLKWPVTVVEQLGDYLVHSEGFKLYFERWESNNFNKLAFFDGSMCITSLSSIKNFLLLGDLRKGFDFVQWKEDAVTQNRNLRRLARSPPSVPMTVLACEFIVCGKSLGMVALDHGGTAHLFQYSPHSDGREGDQLLRSCATFSMGSPCRAALRLQAEPGVQCLFAASGGGELLCLRPIDDQVYRTVTTMLGMLSTRLPFRCGLNPRALRARDGPPALVAPRKNIEDANMLRLFAFLSAPLQAAVAEKMRLPVASLVRTALPCATCQLAALRATPAT